MSTDLMAQSSLPPLGDKTLVCWASPTDLSHGGGTILTLDDQATHFDGIVFGELRPATWMAGSDGFMRTRRDQEGLLAETTEPGTLVQMAITYQGTHVTVYRNGEVYSEHDIAAPMHFGPGSAVLMGVRHILSGDRSGFTGQIEDARIYDGALSAEQIHALRPNEASEPRPLAWWDFEGGSVEDRMGCFPAGRLVKEARVENGRLVLDGKGSYFITPAQAAPREPVEIPYYDSPVNYRPEVGVFADPIPFYWEGTYHVFYLQGGVGKVPWRHIVSTDLVNWTEVEPALLPDGADDSPDGEHMFTGSVTEKDGTFYIFYTGCNDRYPGGQQTLRRATSPDLIHWTKDPDWQLRPDGVSYKNHHACDWRDPYVFYNEEVGKWWMVLCSNTIVGEGGAGLMVSDDLTTWTPELPLRASDFQECPDLFKIGDLWYLIGGDHFSYARDPRGPYLRPRVSNVIDRPGVYAGKRMFDGKRHVWVGWAWDIISRRDGDPGNWGGDQCIPRELYPGPGGQLYCRPVEEAVAVFSETVLDLATAADADPQGGWSREGGALQGAGAACLFPTPTNYMMECELRLEPGAEAAVALRRQTDGHAYRLTLRPERSEARLSGPGGEFVRSCVLDTSQPLRVRVFVQGTLIECFINDEVAITTRAYDYQEGMLGVEALLGGVTLEGLRVKVPAAK